jgi:ATP-dependent DNA helicase 2 subunit 2
MTSKEATVYIVDCGKTMGERSHGRQQTNLEWALEYVWDKITATVATGRKTALAGVVGLRTDGTQNPLDAETEYSHITVFQDLSQILMPQLRKLRNDLQVSSTDAGDPISAIIVAIQLIATTCKKLQYQRKIVLVTDARAPMAADDLSEITKKLKEDNIDLVVLGVDFDDPEYGFKEEGKDGTKAENEEVLRQLCTGCGGEYGSLIEAVDQLGIPRVKTTKPVPTFKGTLTLGNPNDFDTAISIDVERYPKTMKASVPSSSAFVVRSDMAATQATQSTTTLDGEDGVKGDDLTAVKNARTYQIDDENAPGGKRDVDRDELSKGYAYGRTAVHINESDQNVTTYENTPGLDIIGFVEKPNYQRYMDMSRASLIVSAKHNDKASMALSSLVHALFELDSYAVARLVKKENNEPRILLLSPCIDTEFECLYDIELPFQEDIRQFKFPPLDRVVTVSGKVLKVHRNLPSGDLTEAMSDYIDSMDLSRFGRDDDGNPTEYAAMDETYNPILHRIHQVIKHRAVHPDAEPPPPIEILTRYSMPPDDLLKSAQPALERTIEAANVKKVPPKARGRFGRRKDVPKPLSNLDVGALLAQDPKRKSQRIDPKNAIAEFKQVIPLAEDEGMLEDACKQMGKIIFDFIRHSVGDSGYQRAIEHIGAMREESAEHDFPHLYNKFLKEMKEKVLKEELGGDRRELWHRIRFKRLGLVGDKELSTDSHIGAMEEEAKAFMSLK